MTELKNGMRGVMREQSWRDKERGLPYNGGE